MKRLAIGFVTYPIRPERVIYLAKALSHARQFLTASRHRLVWFITCESEKDGNKDAVRHLASALEFFCFWNLLHPSMGANENNAMRLAFKNLEADYLLLHIDDCYATAPTDLSDGIDFLEANPDVDILRYHWSSRKECRPIFHPRSDGYMQVDSASKWFYDDSPHIRRANYAEQFDWHYEGKPSDCGITETKTNQSLRHHRAVICATPFKNFEKDGPVSASR